MVVHKANLHQQLRGIVSHMQTHTHTHIQADSVIDIHPSECNHRRLSSPAVWGSTASPEQHCGVVPVSESSFWAIGGRWYPLIRAHQPSLSLSMYKCTAVYPNPQPTSLKTPPCGRLKPVPTWTTPNAPLRPTSVKKQTLHLRAKSMKIRKNAPGNAPETPRVLNCAWLCMCVSVR